MTTAECYWNEVESADDHGNWTTGGMRDYYEECRKELVELEEQMKQLNECVKHFETRKGWRKQS